MTQVAVVADRLTGAERFTLDVVRRNRPPAEAGVYAWWSKEGAIGGVNGTVVAGADGVFLYYVGIGRNLRSRIRNHLGTAMAGSTLRRAVAAALLAENDWATARTSRGKVVLADPADRVSLQSWMTANLLVSWVTEPAALAVESGVIGAMKPPLNHQHNICHEQHQRVAALRSVYQASPRLSALR